MSRLRPLAIATLVSAGIAGCASSNDPMLGTKSLEATVVERQYDPPGSGGASYAGSGNYYLVFEAKEGEATSHYRFRVTQRQYIRYQEGSHVQLVIVDNNLRDIRPLQ